jgi:RNase P subunit RPR2
MDALILGLIFALVMFILMTFIPKTSRFAKYGINIKRVYCPKCGAKQPFTRIPKNEHQALYGGSTCQQCGTEIDKFGHELQK